MGIRRYEMEKHRLFEIVYFLMINKRTTALALADKFEVSVRTIYRDINTLTLANIPIYTESGKGGGIFIDEKYSLDRIFLSEEEQNRLMSILVGVSCMANVMDEKLLLKLKALFGYDADSFVIMDFSRWGKNADYTKFNIVKEAIINKYELIFKYINAKNCINKRKVKPLKVIFKSRSWYLLAEDMNDGIQKYFKIYRMSDIDLADKFADVSSIKGSCLAGEEYPVIQMTFDKSVLYRLYDEFDENDIECLDDSVIVIAKVPVDEWLYGYLLSFCGKVQDVKPTYIMDNLKHIISDMLNKYS